MMGLQNMSSIKRYNNNNNNNDHDNGIPYYTLSLKVVIGYAFFNKDAFVESFNSLVVYT